MVHSRFTLVAPLLALCLAGAPVPAQTLSGRLAAIEARLAEGADAAAMAEARALFLDINERAAFGVQGAVLTVEPATGYGVFDPVPEPVFASGAPVHAYVELHGYSIVPQDDGINAMVFDVAFALHDSDGARLTQVTPMGSVELATRSFPVDAFLHLTYRIRGAEGRYVIWTQVTDRASGESATFELPVTFVPEDSGAENAGGQQGDAADK